MTFKDHSKLYLSIFALYYIVWSQLFKFLPSNVINLYIQPLFWILFIFFLSKQPKHSHEIRMRQYTEFLILCVFVSIFYVITYFLFGAINGYGYSPYDNSLAGILKNLWGLIPMLVGVEYLREKTLLGLRKNKQWIMEFFFITIASLMTFLPQRFLNMPQFTLEQNIQFLSTAVLTRAMLQWLLCRVCILGGWKASSLVSIIFNSYIFLSPVLPNLNWLTQSALGTLFPLFIGLYLINYNQKNDFRFPKRIEYSTKHPIQQAFIYILAILIVWFSVGVFPVFPTVVLTGSMYPAISPGDIVIMKSYSGDKLEQDEIIQFFFEGYFIIHRIIDQDETGYITKGDNNSAIDSYPVTSSQIRGTYLFKIPRLGKINIWFHSLLSGNTIDESFEYELGNEQGDNE